MSAERPLDVIAQEGPPTDSAALKRVSSGSSHAETHEMLLAAGHSTPKELPQIVAKFKAASLDGARSGKVTVPSLLPSVRLGCVSCTPVPACTGTDGRSL